MVADKSNSGSFTGVLFFRVDEYFATQSSGKYANFIFYLKAFLLLLIYSLAYSYFVFYSRSFHELIILAFILGICHVFIPVNISHDAIHGSVSPHRWINNLALYGFEITGANSYMYSRKHLEAHFNKENGSKTVAIETQALLMQTNSSGKTTNLHYVFYVFFALYVVFVRDFLLYSKLSEPISKMEYLKLIVFKSLYCFAFIILPLLFVQLPWWQIVTAVFFMYLVITMVIVIFLLMPTEKMEYSREDNSGLQNDRWLFEILENNVDFSPDNFILSLLAGGANLNVVHFLFPSVNHVHYTKLAAIIEKTTNEYGLLYRKQKVKEVFGIHFNYIKNIQGTNH